MRLSRVSAGCSGTALWRILAGLTLNGRGLLMAGCESMKQIGEVAKELGITTRTIRYYEEIGIMGHSGRDEFGPRKYATNDIIRLKFILKLKELGISLKEMQQLAENYDLNDQDRHKIMPKLLEILEAHKEKIDKKVTLLVSLRKDIDAYQQRVQGILQERAAGD
jgi:DNA-binding transcriptional MerR regulator